MDTFNYSPLARFNGLTNPRLKPKPERTLKRPPNRVQISEYEYSRTPIFNLMNATYQRVAERILGSVYGFLQGAWPFGVVEAVWAVIALRRWHQYKSNPPANTPTR